LGLGLAGIAIVSAVICGAWATAGVYLGRKYERGHSAHDQPG